MQRADHAPQARLKAQALATLALVSACGLLAGCSSGGSGWFGRTKLPSDDNAPTLASLKDRTATVQADTNDARLPSTEARTIAAYQAFLQTPPSTQAQAALQAPQREEALRRLGDLEMDLADRSVADGATPDYRAAIARYEAYLKAHPQAPGNDRVLYQLARAHEQNGALEAALKVLTQLVQQHPGTAYAAEVQFRRGELLFTTTQYAAAEAAYGEVLKAGQGKPGITPFEERALYMQGWSRFKLGRLEEALPAFFAVLDARLASNTPPTRAEAELVDDTLRVTSLSLASLNGAASIPPLVAAAPNAGTHAVREQYEGRVYEALGELYLKQERVKDAADTFAAFARQRPLHPQAPVLLARVVSTFETHGFATAALAAKRDHVARYGRDSALRLVQPEAWAQAQPLFRTYLAELAQHHHALAQQRPSPSAVEEAATWYRQWLAAYPLDPATPAKHLLLAELLFDNRRAAEATAAFEAVAYGYPTHARSADAGYSALLGHAQLLAAAGSDAATRAPVQQAAVASALRFAQSFHNDARTGPVLVNTAQQQYALNLGPAAADSARRALQTTLKPEERRSAHRVLANTAFETQAWAQAEGAYTQVLALTAANAPDRAELQERLAASIYQQGDAARSAGRQREAVAYFVKVASVAPASAVRATAQFDAAAALMALGDSTAALPLLEDFRRRFPQHPLQAQATPQLATAYLAEKRWSLAAAELERIAAQPGTGPEAAELGRAALWQAAELHDKAVLEAADTATPAAVTTARQAYTRYVQAHPAPLANAVQARWRLAELAERGTAQAQATLASAQALADAANAPLRRGAPAPPKGPSRATLKGLAEAVKLAQAAHTTALQAVVQTDAAGGEARSPATRALAAKATLALTTPVQTAYQQVKLVEPLQKQLKLKKQRFEEALKALAAVAEFGVADTSTAATFQTAALYQDFGHALLASERPKKLNKLELAQYNVLLEEQAYPFEEKAITLHEANALRAAAGLYDEPVRQSFAALATLKPGRWGRAERAAAASSPAAEATTRGIALRRQGQFKAAAETYAQATAADAQAPEPVLNLAILHDLYLGDRATALAAYERYLLLQQTLAGSPDNTVQRWVAELKARKGHP